MPILSRPKCPELVAALLLAAGAADVDALVCRGKWSSYEIESGVVFYRNDLRGAGTRVTGADAASFKLLENDPCISGGYARDKSAVYYQGAKVAGADPQSFEVIEGTYAKDLASWYGAGVRLASRRGEELKILASGYAIHPEGVFHGARRLEAEGFEVLGSRGYARSRGRAYFQGEEIPGIDAASFRMVPEAEQIARDKHKVVMDGRVDPRFEAASFEVLTRGGSLVKDRNYVYWVGRPVVGADAPRAASLGHGYWGDGKKVYYRGSAITGADPQSFRVLSVYYSADKHQLYYTGIPMQGADAQSFSLRSAYVGRDKSHGYHYGKRVCVWTRAASPDLPMCDSLQYLR